MSFPTNRFPIGGALVRTAAMPYMPGRRAIDPIELFARPVVSGASQRFVPSDPIAAAAASRNNTATALAGAVTRLAREVDALKARGGSPVGLSSPGQLGMYAAPDQDGKGGIIPFPVITIPAAAVAGTIVEVELESDSVGRGLLTATVLELVSCVVGGGLAGDEISQSAVELSILVNGMTLREFFRVPVDSCIPTAEGVQPIRVGRYIGPDVLLVVQARILDTLSMADDGLIRVRGWAGNGSTYNQRVSF